jgi:hypothetical protein
MDAKELAAKLNGREYWQVRQAGLVVVFGASDDLIEFRGAIRDEGDCYDGREVLIDAKGVLPSWDSASESEESAQEYFERKPKARMIKALFAKEGSYTWTYKTDIPHETFEIVKDGEPYCRGIVFNIGEISPL